MLFWHVGGTIAAVRYVFRDDRMDLRFLILGAVLPDLIDTPVGLFGFGALGSVRLFSHSLVFGSLVMAAVVLATRRGRPRKRWMPLAVGVLMHLVLDAMWADPETLWWPFLGLDFADSGHGTAGDLIASVLTDWRVWLGEGSGVAYLVYLVKRGNLTDRRAWERFKRTGRVAVPIDPR